MEEKIEKIMDKHFNANDFEMCCEVWKEAQKDFIKEFNETISKAKNEDDEHKAIARLINKVNRKV